MIPGRGRFAFHIPPESVFTSLRNPYSQFPGTLIHMPRNTNQRRARPDALAFQRFVPVFDFPVRLWVIRLGSHVRHARDADEFLEVLGDELRPVVGDPPAAPRDASPW